MNPQKDPKYFSELSPGFYSLKSVLFLFCTKAAFRTCRPLFSQFPGDDKTALLTLTCTSFANDEWGYTNPFSGEPDTKYDEFPNDTFAGMIEGGVKTELL